MTTERTPSMLRLTLAIVLPIVATFLIDVVTGREISVSIFYLIPVSVATWYHSRTAGLFISALCAVLWLLGEHLTAEYTNELIKWWNMLVRFGFFIIVTQTLATRRRVEFELRAARADAMAAARAKSDFVSRVTHELRTPLTAILGFADVLTKRASPYLTGDDQECVRRIRANSETLLHMVDGVLDVGRAESGKLTPKVEPVDVTRLAQAVATDMRSRLRGEAVELVVEAPAGLHPVDTDPVLLRQILLNLVGNAVKFTERGYVRLSIVTNGDAQAAGVVIEDTGVGIAADKLESIFDPFEQADESIHRRYGGAGLGLTIAKDFCRLLGYRLEVASEPGVGSRFAVFFRP